MTGDNPKRFVAVLLALLFIGDIVVWLSIVSRHLASSRLELYFLSVGQGDSQLIRLPGNVKILIDGGPATGEVLRELSEVLPEGDRYLDIVVMTHPQLDHFGGLIDVLKRYEVGVFIANGRDGTAKAYGDLIQALEDADIPSVLLAAGDHIRYGDAMLSVLGPTARNLTSKELNDTCIITLLDYRGFRALYVGDIGENIERELLVSDIRAHVLKVGHHGSRFSSSAPFLAAVRPSVAVIEVGKNSYGHPTGVALSRLAGARAEIFRTDRDGTVMVRPNAGILEAYTEVEEELLTK
jgi:competence protein ComEC